MSESPPYAEIRDDAPSQGRDATGGTPRWVKVAAIVALVLVVMVLVMLLAGGGGPGGHGPGRHS